MQAESQVYIDLLNDNKRDLSTVLTNVRKRKVDENTELLLEQIISSIEEAVPDGEAE